MKGFKIQDNLLVLLLMAWGAGYTVGGSQAPKQVSEDKVMKVQMRLSEMETNSAINALRLEALERNHEKNNQ